ncbi:hypothetical protein F2Q69_00048430 [Brassica cretica]|uniref:Uncharacterized protein n=1 Tax=Brassica cretica TaxID=69181 RepID=A0A8S9PK53_BRACR|nr:hypothetical protein F2Q69_00048430 [Brassica cretica]
MYGTITKLHKHYSGSCAFILRSIESYTSSIVDRIRQHDEVLDTQIKLNPGHHRHRWASSSPLGIYWRDGGGVTGTESAGQMPSDKTFGGEGDRRNFLAEEARQADRTVAPSPD